MEPKSIKDLTDFGIFNSSKITKINFKNKIKKLQVWTGLNKSQIANNVIILSSYYTTHHHQQPKLHLKYFKTISFFQSKRDTT